MQCGIEPEQFVDNVISDFVCTICSSVLLKPVSTPCDHHFCEYCINKWLKGASKTCPTCRSRVTQDDLRPMSRIIKNILGNLRVRCSNGPLGCKEVVPYDELEHHEDVCVFDLAKYIVCQRCSSRFIYTEISDHMKVCSVKLSNENQALLLRITKLEFQRNLSISLLVLSIVIFITILCKLF